MNAPQVELKYEKAINHKKKIDLYSNFEHREKKENEGASTREGGEASRRSREVLQRRESKPMDAQAAWNPAEGLPDSSRPAAFEDDASKPAVFEDENSDESPPGYDPDEEASGSGVKGKEPETKEDLAAAIEEATRVGDYARRDYLRLEPEEKLKKEREKELGRMRDKADTNDWCERLYLLN